MRRALAAVAVAALVLTGCSDTEEPTTSETPAGSEPGGSGSPSASDSPSEAGESPTSDSDEPEAIEIEIEGDRIEPNGRRVKVGVGETITFEVESDRAAELHVHSSPEKVIEVDKGESTKTLVIERPGLVDIEEHDTGLILVQLEVS